MTEFRGERCREIVVQTGLCTAPAHVGIPGYMSYLEEVEQAASFAPLASLREYFGFVPNLFRAQTLLPR